MTLEQLPRRNNICAAYAVAAEPLEQVAATLVNNTLNTVVTGAAGKRIEVYGIILSPNAFAGVTLRSGSNTIVILYVPPEGGLWRQAAGDTPLLAGNLGESLSMQSDQATFTASVLLQYRLV